MITRKQMKQLVKKYESLNLGVASVKRDSDMVSFSGCTPVTFEKAIERIKWCIEKERK